jgi:hypothetical protein
MIYSSTHAQRSGGPFDVHVVLQSYSSLNGSEKIREIVTGLSKYYGAYDDMICRNQFISGTPRR